MRLLADFHPYLTGSVLSATAGAQTARVRLPLGEIPLPT